MSGERQDWNGWLPGSTNSRWSLVLGLAFFITGLGSLWGLNDVASDDAMTLLFISAGLLGINQIRRSFGKNER